MKINLLYQRGLWSCGKVKEGEEMKRFAVVDACDNCPNNWWYLGTTCCCILMDKKPCYDADEVLKEDENIPSWCPLDKADQNDSKDGELIELIHGYCDYCGVMFGYNGKAKSLDGKYYHLWCYPKAVEVFLADKKLIQNNGAKE